MHTKKAIIIGAGIAGLASAIRLSAQGFQVIVFEKNNDAGGKIGYLKNNGFAFDTGPSLFVQPENIEELFSLANECISDYFTYEKLAEACKYFYEDGTVINAFTNENDFANDLKQKVNEDEISLKKYLKQSSDLYKNVGEFFLNNSLHKRKTWKGEKILKALAAVKLKYLFKNLDRLNSTSFTKDQTIQLFNRFGTYNGSNPFKMPGMFSLIAHLEQNEGVFYPHGGMINISKSLLALALKLGVQFNFNTSVEKIICNEGVVLGVICKDENHFADVVISNVDAYFTYKNLLNRDIEARKILKQERSSSAIVFYWGMKKEFSELNLHNIFFSSDYKKEFHHLFKLKSLYKDPTVYINITCKCEAGLHAPTGKENWFVMINAPSVTNKNRDEIKSFVRKNIIDKLNRVLKTDIASSIETEDFLDPFLIEQQTNSFDGALYGNSSNSRLAAFVRHPNFNKTIKNLYFAGGTVHPGGGIPLCLKSAKITCDLIDEDFKKQKH